MKLGLFALVLCLSCSAQAQLGPNGATASFLGSLPPKPTADLSPEQQAALQKELAAVTADFQSVKKHERAADADIFLKAVRYALEFHEWYDKKPEDGVKKATALLDEAKKRIESLKKNEAPWMNGSGQKVLGFYSGIDDSPQPYGVEVPEGLEFGSDKKPVPMWIWLHGRGDTATDLHFVYGRLMAKKPGQFQPKGTIVIHPFGRYCNGWKSAGETDVFEARNDAVERFNVDTNRIALAGFSMGGAGAWHLGAHYADQWAVVHTGAGFVDVRRYQKLTPEKMPPWYEQKLWGLYDVPDYAANFHNVPLISYSGEIDAQRDSAEYMTEVLAKEGITRPHLIGPGMPHKYHPETIKEVQKLVEEAVAKGRDPWPKKVTLQTRCLQYNKMFWIKIGQFDRQWDEARVDAEIVDTAKQIRVTTKNVHMLAIEREAATFNYDVVINGIKAQGNGERGFVFRTPDDGGESTWVSAGRGESFTKGEKGWQGSGPIDLEFMHRFIIVLPDHKGAHPLVDQWVDAESKHFISRWRSLMRGDPKVVKASELTDDMSGTRILWGDSTSNSQIAAIADRLNVKWQGAKLTIGEQSFDSSNHVPVLIQGLADRNETTMVVINSGLTFREAHDKTNSLQNPKLPDWAILDITQPPNAESAGKVVAADFFDEHWQVKPNMPPVDSK
ncbi:prolyl oligopeptidase family serine peptidase [soil metagenome]